MRTDMWLEKFAKDNPLANETIRADERAKVVENYCWLKCKCNGNGCVGTPDECFVVATLKCDKLTIAETVDGTESK